MKEYCIVICTEIPIQCNDVISTERGLCFHSFGALGADKELGCRDPGHVTARLPETSPNDKSINFTLEYFTELHSRLIPYFFKSNQKYIDSTLLYPIIHCSSLLSPLV